jgi:hypothetical protein
MAQSTDSSRSLAERMERWVARFADRVPDWEAFEEAKIPGFHRAQHRYVGAGASGKHGDPTRHFAGELHRQRDAHPTRSGQPAPHARSGRGLLRPGWRADVLLVDGEERVDRVLGRWDMVFNPADVVHGYHNHTDRDVYLQIMLGRSQPEVPTYAEERYEAKKYDHLKGPVGGTAPDHARGRKLRPHPGPDRRQHPPEGIDLNYLPMPVEEAFWRMTRYLEFDASEMSGTAYLVERSRPDPRYIAIPVFLSRTFRHSAVYVRTDAGIDQPEDLAGKRVGIPEYGLTALTWVRAFHAARLWRASNQVQMAGGRARAAGTRGARSL